MTEHVLISAKEAKEKGLSHFYTGLPCKHGHISLRKVGSHACVECNKIAFKRAYLKRRGIYQPTTENNNSLKPVDNAINRLLMRKW